jgi:hypothetical protein
MLDPSHIEGLYTSLGAMQVELDADPLELGPKRLNAKIAECRGMLSRCERIFLDVSQSLHRYKREHRAASADFKLRMRDLLTNDPEVRMGRNVTDREAIAANKMRPEAEEIDRLTACVEDLEAVITVVRTKRADLKDIQGRLKDQLKVCQEEISLGGRWGRGQPSLRRDPGSDSVNAFLGELSHTPRAADENLGPAVELLGDTTAPTDRVLEALPDEVPVLITSHPDTEVFTDKGIDDILDILGAL